MSENEAPSIDEMAANGDASEEVDAPIDAAAADEINLHEVTTDDPKTERITELERDVEDWRTRAYRSAADLENLRKRFQKERDELKKFGVEGLLKDILGAVDNLERALGHAEPGNSLAEGVEMVLRQFVQMAAKYGAEPFEAAGKPFDPQMHEAMTQIPTDEAEPGTVMDVFQRGWTLHGRLVRPAMVTVAAAMPQSASQESDVAGNPEQEASNDVDAEG
ncbi:MAG: nucleotide exchange factor GrpE [Myxococcales bacterium]|nr:nucleotide exchange factor GrpE [Myxococcales bacterium]|tara:strand:- start:1233 stop:1892 length:660 start_codon:yes stop_codon:yes gene_type:complete